MGGERVCGSCGTRARPVRDSVLWWVPTVLAWAAVVFVMGLSAVMPPLNLVLIPVLFFVGASGIGFLSQKTERAPRCPACGKVHPRSAEGAPVVTGRGAGPTHEGSVEGRLV